MENEKSGCDIVNALTKRLMNDVVENIFDCLDYQSLKNSETVSAEWYNSILYGRIWKRLWEKNLRISQEWREILEILSNKRSSNFSNSVSKDEEYYRVMCQSVGDCVVSLKRNWLEGKHSKLQFSSFGQPEIESIYWIRGSLNFEMNKKWIGRGQQNGSVILWNRWNWETKALFEPLLLRNRLLGCNTVRCVQFNDDLVVASYFEGSICVWDLNTTELLQVLDEMNIANYNSHYIPMNGLSLGGSPGCYWLLSFLSSPTEPNVVTLREIKNPALEEISIVHRIVLNLHLRVLRLLIDEKHALLLVSDTESKQDRIQIRSISSMDVLRVIQIPYSEMGVFDCKNGMILVASRYEIQLWDEETETCLRKVRSDSCIVFVKIISDQYWVSCNASGQVQVWNLQAALKSDKSGPMLLYELNATTVVHPLLCPIIQADEYQIALIPCRAKDYSELHIIDFLQLHSGDIDSN